MRVRRYRSRKCVVGWDEFVAWRAERGGPVSAVDLVDDRERALDHLGHGQEGEDEDEDEDEDEEEDEDKGGF